MRVGIIGSGYIGGALAKKLSQAGHLIQIANSRGPETIQFADNEKIIAKDVRSVTEGVDAIILSIPLASLGQLPKGLFDQVNGKVPIIETTNYYPRPEFMVEDIEKGKAHSAYVQDVIGRPVIKAFNNIVASSLDGLAQPPKTSGRIALPVSGDNLEQVDIAMGLVDDAGFDPYHAGSIEESWRQQPVAKAYCTDLTLEELKAAITEADKDEVTAVRNLAMQKMFEYMGLFAEKGQDYFEIVVTGNYPDGFDKRMTLVNLYRSLYNMPLR